MECGCGMSAICLQLVERDTFLLATRSFVLIRLGIGIGGKGREMTGFSDGGGDLKIDET